VPVQAFKEIQIRGKRLALIEKCNEIIETYMGQGLRLTLRQLYYQLVSRNIVPNLEKSYKNLSNVVSDARLAGLMDWDAIEDRGRVAWRHSQWDSVGDLVESALASYRLPRWAGQENYVELWVEKQALAGVLEPLADEFHATLMVNKGYSSQSAMYESANRIQERCGEGPAVVLYLGDHDPSGEDMVRDVEDRLLMFGCEDLEVRKLALTMDQIRRYNPPPNPAKITDPRAASYIARHGNSSWEVDALPPNILQALIRSAFEELVDMRLVTQIKKQEERDKADLRKATDQIMKRRK
jgi:hypothetical protein